MSLVSSTGRGTVLGTCLTIMAVCTAATAHAQDSEIEEEIIVVSTRVDTSVADVPAAMTVLDKDKIQKARQQLGLDESLNRVPGVFAQNRYNFAQDLRIAIRGFGARANFGIRGIKVYADGIPSTTADGQSGVDDIDLGSVERIEVTRGPYSALYGASSGGVINLITESGPETPFIEAALTGGDDSYRKVQLKAGGQTGKLNYFVSANDLSYRGYRDNSDVEATIFNSKFRYDIDDRSDLTVVMNYVDSPTADDAGAITAADVEADPKQAQARNLSSNAGEELDQQKLGLVYRRALSDNIDLIVRNYYVWRDFAAFLPIGSHIPFVSDDGVVEFERFFYGGGFQLNFDNELFGRPNKLTVGVDLDMQEDDRQRYNNDAGIQGDLTFDQLEEAESYGVFLRNELSLSDQVGLILGVRYDEVELSVDDRFLANDDQSSTLDFDEISPMVGLVFHAHENLTLYGNYGKSFETPTFTELASPARNLSVSLGGFSNVKAQVADSVEVGARGKLWDGRIQIDAAVFTMDVEDEITSVANIGNRSFFENADTDRSGFELSATAEILEGLNATLAYTNSDFEFADFPDNPEYNGNALPGLPETQVFGEISYSHESGVYVVAEVIHVDELYANNSNGIVNDSSTVANLRAGHDFDVGDWSVRPFLGVNNLTNTDYNSNVRINGFGGRLFEPAPDRNWYGGVAVSLSL